MNDKTFIGKKVSDWAVEKHDTLLELQILQDLTTVRKVTPKEDNKQL